VSDFTLPEVKKLQRSRHSLKSATVQQSMQSSLEEVIVLAKLKSRIRTIIEFIETKHPSFHEAQNLT
jgi:hypothetical protein